MDRAPEIAKTPSRGSGQAGMTLIEVMVSMLLLLVGVFGVIGLLDTGNQVTKQNLSRDVASGMAREQLERVRELDFADLHEAGVVADSLASRIGDPDDTNSGDAVVKITRRGVTYTTTIDTCVLDDPSDGLGGVEGEPCDPVYLPPGTGGPSEDDGEPPPPGVNLNVLGVPVGVEGNVVAFLCGAGLDNSLLAPFIDGGGLLDNLVGSGAGVATCPDGDPPIAVDGQPNDATRVTTTVDWAEPSAGSVSQRTLIIGPRSCERPDPEDAGRCLPPDDDDQTS